MLVLQRRKKHFARVDSKKDDNLKNDIDIRKREMRLYAV